MERLIFHVDVNSAYLSWESVRRVKSGLPDLRLIPSCIGGDPESRRGVVLAKSIPAKKYNIRTGGEAGHGYWRRLLFLSSGDKICCLSSLSGIDWPQRLCLMFRNSRIDHSGFCHRNRASCLPRLHGPSGRTGCTLFRSFSSRCRHLRILLYE